METISVKFNDKTENIPKDTLEKIPFFKDALNFEKTEKEIVVRFDYFVFQAMLAKKEGFENCDDHLCSNATCDNTVTVYGNCCKFSQFCSTHKCFDRFCDNQKIDDKGHCAEHMCAFINCKSKGINGTCTDHKCNIK